MPEGEAPIEVEGGLDFAEPGVSPLLGDQAATGAEGSAAPETVQEQAEAPEQAFEIGGKTVTLKELQDGYMRYSDYTKKTMALGEQAKELETARTFVENFKAATQDPEGTKALIGQLQRHLETLGASADDPVDGFEYSEGESLLKRQLDAQTALTRRLADEVKALRESALPEIESIKAEKRLSAAVSELRQTMGVETTPAQLRAYVESSGIDDPVKAYKVATYDEAVKGSYVSGHQTASKKPLIPKGSARGVDFEDENLVSADEIFRLALAEANAKKTP